MWPGRTSLHLADPIFVQNSSETIHFPPCPHLIFPVALQLFVIGLSSCIVYSSHEDSIVRGKTCFFAQPDSPVWAINNVGLLELLIYCSLGSILLKMKIDQKQSRQEMYSGMLLYPAFLLMDGCRLNVGEHALVTAMAPAFREAGNV